jgi:hypothetical protein
VGASASISHLDELGREGPRVGAVAAYLEVRPEDVLTELEAGTAHYSTSLDAPLAGAEGDDSQSLADNLGCDDDRLASSVRR